MQLRVATSQIHTGRTHRGRLAADRAEEFDLRTGCLQQLEILRIVKAERSVPRHCENLARGDRGTSAARKLRPEPLWSGNGLRGARDSQHGLHIEPRLDF